MLLKAGLLPLVALYFNSVSTVPVNFQENYDMVNDEKSGGMAFFDQFQSMFGWGNDPVTTERPTTPAPVQQPHAHTATSIPYYGGRHVHGGPSFGHGQRPHTTTRSPLPPVPGMYPQHSYTGYSTPQYSQYSPYPYQPYYSSPYYNPYYPQSPYYPPQAPPAPRGPASVTTAVPPLDQNTLPPVSSIEAAEDPEDSAKLPNKHKAVPNKAAMVEPMFPMPFPVTKSFLPLSILPPEDCHSESGMVGECLSAAECGATSGEPSGLCHMGRDVSLHARVCCSYPAHCGYETNHRVTYLRSPSYPEPVSAVSDCPFTVNLLPGVCQVRLDFLDFQMKPIHHGSCDLKNSLLIKSAQKSTMIPMPRLCGNIASGQEDPLRTDVPHLYTYFDVDPAPEKGAKKVPNKDTRPTLELHFNVENYPSVWNIRVSQIVCDGANLQAPTGCAQYYNSNSGNISSINLPDREYMADTTLDICLARDPTACAIKYKLKKMGVGPTKGGALGYGLVCDDFLKFRGEKTGICGKGDGREMILPVRGPMGLTFQSDSSNIPGADVGYDIEYRYLHDCEGLQYFKYPSTK